ncbi:lasso peptide biosynthesis B2 protein [Paenibacillus jiagnxiensis]|uniref:lasso peptide biosynthesis B2 protein n=1 Tax=Paenibacillus jiagnxiensis TaxID=3228926 RepID=UPI0033AEF1B3
MWSKIKKFISSSPSKRKLFMEACFYLAWARILKSLPFSRVAPSLGASMLETPYTQDPRNEPALRAISYAVRTMSRHTLWENTCLVKAIAAVKMLERRGIESTLYMGTAKDHAGKMIAHAWVRSGSVYITGFEEMEKFTVVGTFGKPLNSKAGKRGLSKA